MPVFLSTSVPVGLMGLLVAAMLAADMSTDSSYMLTWGGVIYNDLLAPFRKTPWSERRGLRWNRAIVALIGLFLLVYGLWYPLEGDIWTYLIVTGTIYLSSMSTLLIACCYWKRANSWALAARDSHRRDFSRGLSGVGKTRCHQGTCGVDRPESFGHRGLCGRGPGHGDRLAVEARQFGNPVVELCSWTLIFGGY